MTNTHTPDVVNVTVTKVWSDSGNQDGIRPKTIQIKLLADGTELTDKLATLSAGADEEWQAAELTYTWTNLPKYAGTTTPIVYTVAEQTSDIITGTDGPGTYSFTVTGDATDGYTVTNTHTPVTIEKTINKVWDDANNQDGIRPDSVEVVLTGTAGTYTKTYAVTLNGTIDDEPTGAAGYEYEAWKAKFINLPKYNNGTEITYTYSETETAVITGTDTEGQYAYSWDGNTVTNKHTPVLTQLKVTKTWDDNDNQDGKRPSDATVQLYKTVNGMKSAVEGKTATVPVEDGEIVIWTGLPVYEGGKVITYSVEETLPDDTYTKSGDDVELVAMKDDTGEIVITNLHEPEKTTITVKKFWKDNDDSQKKRNGVKAQFYLQKTVDGVSMEIRTVTVGKDQNWTHTWEDLPVYENGKAITYSVREVLAKSNGYTCDTTDWKVVTNGGTIKITNTLKDDTPGTGDNTKILLWAGLTLMSAVGCGGALVVASRRKRKETEQ